jgi:hypothetical protein
VYFNLRASDDEQAHLRWRAVADELARQGADDALIETVREHTMAAVPGPGPRAIFAAGGEILLAVDMPSSAQPDLARYDGLPHVLPLLEWLQARPAHLTALVDRTGADITVYPGGSAQPIRRGVRGPDDEIERNAPGGWAQGRYQHRAEDSWEHNAARVADVLVQLVDQHGIGVVLLAGDVRALQYLEKHLPDRIKRTVTIRRLSGGRSPDGSEELRATQLAREIGRAVADETASLLAVLDDQRSPGGRTVVGSKPTLHALAQGRVGVLLIAPPTEPHSEAWYAPYSGTGGMLVAAEPATLQGAGADPRRGHLVDVAVAAALLTRAHVRVLPPTEAPPDGIAALYRFS